MSLDNGKERVKKDSRRPQEKRMLYWEELLRLIVVVCYPKMPEIASNLGNVSSFIGELVDVNDGIHNV